MPRRGAADDSGLVVVSALQYIVARLKSDDRGRAEAFLNMAVKEFRALGSTQFAGTWTGTPPALLLPSTPMDNSLSNGRL